MNTKQKLFISAKSLFYERGYSKTSIRDVADKAQVNVAMISYYYNCKENLFMEFIRLLDNRLSILIGFYNNKPESKELVLRYILDSVNFCFENKEIVMLYFREKLLPLSEATRELTKRVGVKHYQLFRKLYKGSVDKHEPYFLYVTIFGAIQIFLCDSGEDSISLNDRKKLFKEHIKHILDILK